MAGQPLNTQGPPLVQASFSLSLANCAREGEGLDSRLHLYPAAHCKVPPPHLKHECVVVLLEEEGKGVGVHEGLSALAQNVHRSLHELCLDPRNVHGLQLLHLGVGHLVQLRGGGGGGEGERGGGEGGEGGGRGITGCRYRSTDPAAHTHTHTHTLCSILRLFWWFM